MLVLGGGCLLGGLLGSRVRADVERPDSRLRGFARVLALVEDNYVGKVDSHARVESAIQGMLRTLDPHSNYLDRDSYTEMKDEQRGKFYGLGIQITKRGPDKPLTIIAPIDGTPASRAGLQAGDIIYKIEGEETINLTVQQAVRKLKGDKGTRVSITIQRPGEEAPFDVSLLRDEIPTHSIPVSFMIRPDVGLIRISNFTSTTSTELGDAVHALKAKGMNRLVLDLRSNPGGLLEQAVQVSEKFIPAGKLVVYTRGRVPGSDQDYTGSKGVERVTVPLVVLVDHSSASASEIVSGAIQDHDCGLVVGEPTFGKGLVQRVIPLRDGGALALTTAKYYTPSGRLIQRDFSDLDDYFLEPGDEGSGGEEPIGVEKEAAGPGSKSRSGGAAITAAPDPSREVRHTDSGRIVYGGGGITPDYLVRTERATPFMSRLMRENLMFDFAVRYVGTHSDLREDFVIEAPILAEFRAFLQSRKFEFDDATFEANRASEELRLKAQIGRVKWGAEKESLILANGDPQVLKALTLFDEAARLAQAGEQSRLEKDRQEAKATLEAPTLSR